MGDMQEMLRRAATRASAKLAARAALEQLDVADRVGVLAELLVEADGAPPVHLFPASREKAHKPAREKKERRPRPTSRPSPRKGGAGGYSKGIGSLESKVIPGMTTGQVAQKIASIVAKSPKTGMDSIAIAAELGAKDRKQILRTIGLAKDLGLIRQEGRKRQSRYFPASS